MLETLTTVIVENVSKLQGSHVCVLRYIFSEGLGFLVGVRVRAGGGTPFVARLKKGT